MAKKMMVVLSTGLLIIGIFVFINKDKNVGKEQTTTQSTEVTSPSTTVVKPSYPGKVDDWELLLVNDDHRIEKEPENLTTLPNGKEIDSRIDSSFSELLEAGKKAGYTFTVISAYRSVAEQEGIVARDIQDNLAKGYSEKEATEKAMAYLTEPGLSEHHTGLAIDVLEEEWYNQGNMLEEEFGQTDGGKWLDSEACHYGFVIRYEKGKEKITGINYEPWHIRYVGKENAEYMKKNNLVLEEYIEQLKSR